LVLFTKDSQDLLGTNKILSPSTNFSHTSECVHLMPGCHYRLKTGIRGFLHPH